jgi:transposase
VSQNFLGCDREQVFLLPPSLDEWLPEDHFARFVIAAVEAMDLSALYADYRADGRGRPAHDPAMMVALLVYAYARGQRSSRVIERGCFEDVAARVITANRQPDHTTIARFRRRHETPLAGVFGHVLGLCAQAGLAGVAVLAVDGTRVHANASERATRDYEQLAAEALREAAEIDAAEDERFGDRRGDELPPELATAQGRKKWLEAARRRLDVQREQEARPIPQSRPARVREAKRRLEEELASEVRANAAYEAYRANGRMKNGRRFGSPPKPYTPPDRPAGKINVTDPDSRTLKTPRGFLQGYNAQAVCNEHQIVVAAEVSVSSADFGQIGPMIDNARAELAAAGVTDRPGVVLADAGYWHGEQIDTLMGQGVQVLIPPDADKRRGTRPGWDGGRYAFMRNVLATAAGGELYAQRQQMIEPVFADTKFNRRCDRFSRRGRAAARSEWRLITATGNLRG